MSAEWPWSAHPAVGQQADDDVTTTGAGAAATGWTCDRCGMSRSSSAQTADPISNTPIPMRIPTRFMTTSPSRFDPSTLRRSVAKR